MSPQPHIMMTKAKNATQHPGHIQQKPCQPAGPSAKSKKVDTAAVKATAKRLGAEWHTKFEQDAIEREDVLDTTPCPIFTPTAGHALIPTSDPSSTTSVLKSGVDTDEMNPDKRTYNPSSTMEDDSDRDLSATPIAKRTYTEVAGPKCKPGVATSTTTALDT